MVGDLAGCEVDGLDVVRVEGPVPGLEDGACLGDEVDLSVVLGELREVLSDSW